MHLSFSSHPSYILPQPAISAVSKKLLVGGISAAVRLFASDYCIIKPSPKTVEALRLKHPAGPADIRQVPIPDILYKRDVSNTDIINAHKTSTEQCRRYSTWSSEGSHFIIYCRGLAPSNQSVGFHWYPRDQRQSTNLASGSAAGAKLLLTLSANFLNLAYSIKSMIPF